MTHFRNICGIALGSMMGRGLYDLLSGQAWDWIPVVSIFLISGIVYGSATKNV